MSERLPDPIGSARRSLADRLCDGFIAGLGVWTLAANGAVFLGGNLYQLETATAAIAGAAIAGTWLHRRARPRRQSRAGPEARTLSNVRRREVGDSSLELGAERSTTSPPPALWQRLAVAAAALLSVGLYAGSGRSQTLWLCAIPWLGLLCLRELVSRPAPPNPEAPRRGDEAGGRRALLFGLALLCSILTLVAHRPDTDDAFYVNMAVAAADHPGAPLIAGDTLHGVDDVPLTLPIYKVHSLELLSASLSHLTGLPALTVAHLWLPAVAAFLVPLAYARLLRLLMPQAWLWGTFLAMAFLLLTGGESCGWGSFAFVRLQQGKAVLLSLGLPLLLAYAMEFGLAPTTGRWLRLAAAQIAAVGLSASALWLAPTLAGLALACACAPLRASMGRLLAGLAASAYPLALGLWLRGDTESVFREAAVQLTETAMQSDALIEAATSLVLGQGLACWLGLFVALGSWCVAPSALARRFCALFPLAFLLVFLNPFTASWIASHVTSGPTYWRVFWVLPLPVLMTLMLGAPLALRGRSRRRWVGPCLSLAAAAVALVWVPATPALSRANRVHLDWPGWKVPPEAFAAARAVVRHAAPGAAVLAPRDVAPWIPTLHGYPHPIVVRMAYLPILDGRVEDRELERRVGLFRLVSGDLRPPHADALLAEAVHDYPLEAVVLIRDAALTWPDLPHSLERSGLQLVQRNDAFEVWARPSSQTDGETIEDES